MVEFSKLQDWQLKVLKKSWGFDIWKIQNEKTKIMDYFIDKTLLGKFLTLILTKINGLIKKQ